MSLTEFAVGPSLACSTLGKPQFRPKYGHPYLDLGSQIGDFAMARVTRHDAMCFPGLLGTAGVAVTSLTSNGLCPVTQLQTAAAVPSTAL